MRDGTAREGSAQESGQVLAAWGGSARGPRGRTALGWFPSNSNVQCPQAVIAPVTGSKISGLRTNFLSRPSPDLAPTHKPRNHAGMRRQGDAPGTSPLSGVRALHIGPHGPSY